MQTFPSIISLPKTIGISKIGNNHEHLKAFKSQVILYRIHGHLYVHVVLDLQQDRSFCIYYSRVQS